MNKTYSLLCTLTGLFLVVSCNPNNWITPGSQPTPSTPPPSAQPPRPSVEQTVTSPAQKKIRETQNTLNQNTGINAPGSTLRPPAAPAAKKTYPTARKIEGRPGWVFNPYNNNNVFIGDIPSGKLVRDPNDANPEHKFRVP